MSSALNGKRRRTRFLTVGGGVSRRARCLVALVFAAGLTWAGCGGTGGNASATVPATDVAVIDDSSINVPGLVQNGEISKDDFSRFLLQTAKQSGLQSVPHSGNPRYERLKDQAMQTALQTAWIEGEAHKEGITFTSRELQQSLQQIKSQFKTQAAYVNARDRAGLNEADVLERAKLQLIQNKIQERISNSVSGTGSSAAQRAAAQQSALSSFGQTFRESWQRRTVCAAAYVTTGCANGPPATSTTPRTSP